MGRLFTRRNILLPTLLGWGMILALVVTVMWLFVHSLHGFLATNRPAKGAELLVVEGWLSERDLLQAMEIFAGGDYTMLVTTGGPIDHWPELLGFATFAELAAHQFRAYGIPASQVVAVSAPASAQDRTFLSAVKFREWLYAEAAGVSSLDILSGGPHARRTWRLFRAALGPGVEVGVLSVGPSGYEAATWWRSSAGVKVVLGELISLTWTVCCFWPPAAGSAEETWGATPESSPAVFAGQRQRYSDPAQ